MSKRLTKIRAGYYELRTGDGALDRYEVLNEDNGYGSAWYLTYPGELSPSDACDTLAAARELIGEGMRRGS
jgi:hypothetical protein